MSVSPTLELGHADVVDELDEREVFAALANVAVAELFVEPVAGPDRVALGIAEHGVVVGHLRQRFEVAAPRVEQRFEILLVVVALIRALGGGRDSTGEHER